MWGLAGINACKGLAHSTWWLFLLGTHQAMFAEWLERTAEAQMSEPSMSPRIVCQEMREMCWKVKKWLGFYRNLDPRCLIVGHLPGLISILLLLSQKVRKEMHGPPTYPFGGAGTWVQRKEVEEKRWCQVLNLHLFSQGPSWAVSSLGTPDPLRAPVYPLGLDRSYDLCPALPRCAGSQGTRNSCFGYWYFIPRKLGITAGKEEEFLSFLGGLSSTASGIPFLFSRSKIPFKRIQEWAPLSKNLKLMSRKETGRHCPEGCRG